MKQFTGANALYMVKLWGEPVEVRNVEIALERSFSTGVTGDIEVIMRPPETQQFRDREERLRCGDLVKLEIYWKDGSEIVCDAYLKTWKKDLLLSLTFMPAGEVIALRLDRDVEPLDGYDTGAPISGVYL